jgi:hypothetical protein
VRFVLADIEICSDVARRRIPKRRTLAKTKTATLAAASPSVLDPRSPRCSGLARDYSDDGDSIVARKLDCVEDSGVMSA